MFRFTPAVSFLVSCTTKEDVDALWTKLSEGDARMSRSPWNFGGDPTT
jgi:predicted 3-demethylubiquinone-9 3-methyltransferase (glyoxalase superfamily)